jgi:hypothetical protein
MVMLIEAIKLTLFPSMMATIETAVATPRRRETVGLRTPLTESRACNVSYPHEDRQEAMSLARM